MSVIHGRVPISDFDAPPAFQWSEHHKQIGSAVALVFIIVAPGLSRLHPDWGTSFLYKLLGGLVHANQGMIGIVGPLIDFQHIFHRRYECAVRLGRNNPLLLDVGFENVFFRTRPIVLSLALSTIFSSTTFSSSSRNVQRTRPLGGSRISIIRYPSYFTSCSQSGPAGTLSALMGNANVYNILSAKKLRQSIDVLDLTGIAHVPTMRALRQFVTQVRHRNVGLPTPLLTNPDTARRRCR